jgi:hypothetical protein
MTMTERGILFSAPMVRAILRDEKTVTRRAVKWPLLGPSDGRKRRVYRTEDVAEVNTGAVALCPYGRAGDRLWVRETFARLGSDLVHYRAGGWNRPPGNIHVNGLRWKPGIHMPRTASRLTLEVVSVRVEELHAITEEEAVREGVDAVSVAEVPRNGTLSRRDDFAQLWEKINGRGSWALNPWVWRVEFKVVEVRHA